jgi:hypothetical protein
MTTVDRSLPSRIKGPLKILKQLRTLQQRASNLRLRNDRASNRCETPEEQRWCARTGDRLEEIHDRLQVLIREGDAVLPDGVDPRDQRRVRKRKV